MQPKYPPKPIHPSLPGHSSASSRWSKITLGAVASAVLALAVSGCVISQPLLGAPSQSVAMAALPAASAQSLQTHVKALSQDFFARSFDQPAQLQRAANYIFNELQTMGYQPVRQSYDVKGQAFENIVLRLGPADAGSEGQQSQQPLLVMGAHYDSVRSGELQSAVNDQPAVPTPESHTPGADDNASGVAGLLELARLLKGQTLAQPLELVFYTLEEPPNFRTEFMGSYQHAKSLKDSGRAVRLMLSVEMIGYFSDAPGSQHYPLAPLSWLYPDTGNFLALIGELQNFAAMRRTKGVMQSVAAGAGQTRLALHSLNSPRWVHGVDFSDHLNYWNFDYPAIMVTDTSFMRNANYHQSTDTWDTLNYERMAQVVQMLAAVALDTGS